MSVTYTAFTRGAVIRHGTVRYGKIITVPAPVYTARNATVLNYVIPN